MAEVALYVAGAVGIGSGLAILFHALRKYDVPHVETPLFESPTVFMLFAVGMVFGGVSAVAAVVTVPYSAPFLILLPALVFVALFEELFKMIVVNFKRFQLKYDTTFYGLSLGVGIGSMSMVIVSAILIPPAIESIEQVLGVILMVLYVISVTCLHASTGALLGLGSATGYVWSYFFQAMIARIAYAGLIVPFLNSPPEIGIPFMIAAVLLSFLLYAFTYFRILPETLPDKERKRRRREIRKMRIGSKD